MKNYFLLLLSLMLLGLGACSKKELPEPIAGEPVVWIKCKINGIPWEFKAGEGVTYVSSATYNIDSIYKEYQFKISDLNSKQSLQVVLVDSFRPANSFREELDMAIQPGRYRYTYASSFPFKLNAKEVIFDVADYTTSYECYTLNQYQTSASNFEIISVKDVEHDGKPYKLAEIKFNCRIKNTNNTGWYYEVTDGHAQIPFGHR